MSEKRDLKADLEEWHSDLIHGTGKTDWFYLVENYINRAIEAEEKAAYLTEENDIQRQAIQNLSSQVVELRDVLNDIYPDIAGHVILLKYAGEEKAANDWNIVATKIFKAIDSPAPGAEIRERLAKLEKFAESAQAYCKAVDAFDKAEADIALGEIDNDYHLFCAGDVGVKRQELDEALASLKDGDTP